MFLGQLAAMLERRRLTAAPAELPRAWGAQLPVTPSPGSATAARARGRWPISITRLEAMAAAQRTLPYALTGAQERALADVVSDLAGPAVMMRLLQVRGVGHRAAARAGDGA